jgi:hypothetical protein
MSVAPPVDRWIKDNDFDLASRVCHLQLMQPDEFQTVPSSPSTVTTQRSPLSRFHKVNSG